jgi:hypothetical protein
MQIQPRQTPLQSAPETRPAPKIDLFLRGKGAYPEGISSFTFNMSGLSPNNYVLDFWLDGYLVHGAVVMKR